MTNLQEKSTKLGTSIYYLEQALMYSKKYALESNVLAPPFLSFLYQFYQAQLYECAAAYTWSLQSEVQRKNVNEDNFPNWSRFMASSLKYYQLCAKVEKSFSVVLKQGYIQRFQISTQRHLQLLQLLYFQSAYYQTRAMHHKLAKADALYCQQIGGNINISDFFDSPADSCSRYEPFEFAWPAKFAQWGCIVQTGRPIGVVTQQQVKVIEEIQGYLASRIEGRQIKAGASSEFKSAIAISDKLSALEQKYADSNSQYEQLRQLSQRENLAKKLMRFTDESFGKEILQLCNNCSVAKATYENVLKADADNKRQAGSLWDSEAFCKQIHKYLHALGNMLEIYKQTPTCVTFLRKIDVMQLKSIIERASNVNLKSGTDSHTAQIAEFRQRLSANGVSSEQIPNKFWIAENSALPIERQNAKQITEGLYTQLFGENGVAKSQVNTEAFGNLEAEFERLVQSLEAKIISLDGQEKQLVQLTISAFPTIDSLEAFYNDAQDLSAKHFSLATKVREEYTKQA